jgi:CBS domain containing-hemolysin-like protein
MTGPSGLLVASRLFAVVVLVLANGFFVAAEFALVVLRRSRVDQLVAEGHPRASNLQRAVSNLDTYLAATQLGVTMSSLGLGWLGEPAIATFLEPTLESLLPENLAQLGAHTVSVVIAFTIITALHIVLGELAPKSLALQRPEGTALFVVQLLELYLAIFRPAVQALNGLGNFVLTLLGLKAGGGEELVHSPEEIRLLVSASREAGLLGEAEEGVVERVFRLGERRVTAFMTPRIDMVWLDIEEPIVKLQHQITASVYSHFPVCQENVDNLLGFVGAKEFLAATVAGTMTVTDLLALLTPPLAISESMRALNALEVFKDSGSHVAIVVDEYGATQGLVTLNDILEEIVGDIQTGNEPADPQAVQTEDGAWLLDGMLAIEDFKDIFNLRKSLPGEGIDYQTLGGFVLSQLGHIPVISESFEWDKLQIQVMAMDGHRVDQLRIVLMPKDTS